MKIDIDPNLSGKSVEELRAEMSNKLQQLFATLQKQPNFYLDLDPSTPLPNSLAPQTIVFQLNSTNTLKVAVWDGKHANPTT